MSFLDLHQNHPNLVISIKQVLMNKIYLITLKLKIGFQDMAAPVEFSDFIKEKLKWLLHSFESEFQIECKRSSIQIASKIILAEDEVIL